MGALTTIPVVAMGAFALAVPSISARIGRTQTVWLAMALLVVAMSSRLAGEVPGVLPVSVLLAGVGIALAAGLVPGIVREQTPDAVGLATGLWTGSMFAGATAGAALTVPIANLTGSWTMALAVWAIPAALAWAVWTVVEKPYRLSRSAGAPVAVAGLRTLPWRNRTAWALTAYLALNSIVFYSAVAWLAPSYAERGWSEEASGLLFGLFSAAQIAAAFLLPPMAERSAYRRVIFGLTVVGATIALVLIGLAPGFLPLLVLIVFGATHSGGFTIGLAMLSEYPRDGAGAARLTAMAFAVTYLFAAVGPVASGAILQWSNSWEPVFLILAALCAAQLLAIIPLRRGIVID
jgi:CP family cyanate transporter-like MFS transporter